MNKTIKKIVALGMGATMLAGTAAMALAADLSDYPSPFVKDGVFVGKIVIGEKAASIDTVGALDIAASLQRAAAVGVSGTGTTGTATVTDGYQFTGSDTLVAEYTLADVTSTVDDTDLPELLASGTIEADDGTEYDYDVELGFSTSAAVVSADVASNGDLEDDEGIVEPVVFLDLNQGTGIFYTITVDFEDNWNASELDHSETLELFGTQYTLDPDNEWNDDVLTMYGSETTILIAKGGEETVKYNGEEYTIEVLGGNSDESTAILRINGDTRTVSEGDSKTMPSGGLPIYVKNVFVSNIGGDDVSVQLFIGSDKIELDTDGTVTKNGLELDGVSVNTRSNWGDVSDLTFTVTPTDTEDEVEYILPGKSYVDPLFDAFKIEFVGAKDLTAGKELVEFKRNSDAVQLTFTPRESTKALTLTLAKENSTAFADDVYLFHGTNLTNLVEKNIFLYNEDVSTEDKAVTHVLEIKNIKKGNNTDDDDFEVVINDWTTGKTYTVTESDADETLSDDVELYVRDGATEDYISFSDVAEDGAYEAVHDLVYTRAGAKLDLNLAAAATEPTTTLLEDIDGDYDTLLVGDLETFTVTTVYDGDDEEYNLGVSGDDGYDNYGSDDNVDYYLSQYGTYVALETDDNGAYVKFYVPSAEVSYDAFLTPLDAEVVVTSGSTGGAVALNPISVGMAILDSEASLGSKPYIVVGGPCANTVAAELLESGANCAEGFTEGKAMIKLYNSQNALLVAGFSGKDTQGACRVLASYTDPKYALDGTEIEVITTTLSDLTIKKLS
ncbi:MAG: hypothetical protein ACP5NW_01840 [Candidatus Woesearchaeota archaeon]